MTSLNPLNSYESNPSRDASPISVEQYNQMQSVANKYFQEMLRQKDQIELMKKQNEQSELEKKELKDKIQKLQLKIQQLESVQTLNLEMSEF